MPHDHSHQNPVIPFQRKDLIMYPKSQYLFAQPSSPSSEPLPISEAEPHSPSLTQEPINLNTEALLKTIGLLSLTLFLMGSTLIHALQLQNTILVLTTILSLCALIKALHIQCNDLIEISAKTENLKTK